MPHSTSQEPSAMVTNETAPKTHEDRSPLAAGVDRGRDFVQSISSAGPSAGAVRTEWKERLPGWMQPFLTWLMGYPYRGQKPLLGEKPWWLAVLIPAAILATGLALAVVTVDQGGYAWLALPVAWLMVVNGARALQVHICH